MNYNQSEINFMRQDALRRTREMHNRSGQNKSNVQAHAQSTASGPMINDKSVNSNLNKSAEQKNSNPLNGLLSGFFKDGKIDNDKIIIIGLIFLLAKEGADIKLLIALGYILM